MKYKVPSERFRIFVFTNVLKDFIRSSLEMVDLPEDGVMTFSKWCCDNYRKFVGDRLPWDAAGHRPDFAAIEDGVLRTVQRRHDLAGSLDFVMVDEGQDLSPKAFEILSRVSRHVTVFTDHRQRIFEGGAGEKQILRSLGLDRRNATLLEALRNSPYVAQLGSYFIADPESRQNYLNQVRTAQTDRERPLCFIAYDHNQEMDRLAEMIRRRQMMNERVGIIVPQNDQLFGFAAGLAQRKIVVRTAAAPQDGSGGADPPVRFDDLCPIIATYHSAKGLTFDSVMLPRLNEHALFFVQGELRQRLLFVGIARATKWVYLSATQPQSSVVELPLLRNAERNQHLEIQHGRREYPGQINLFENAPQPPKDEEDISVL